MTIQDKGSVERVRAIIVLSMLSWAVAARGQEATVSVPGTAATTEKGESIGPAGGPQKIVPPIADGKAVQPNGPGSAGTSSNPLTHGPAATVPGSTKSVIAPEQGIYSAGDKDQRANPR